MGKPIRITIEGEQGVGKSILADCIGEYLTNCLCVFDVLVNGKRPREAAGTPTNIGFERYSIDIVTTNGGR